MRGSLGGLPLRAALTRGGLVTAANWPVVLLHFTLASVYRLSLGVPIVGGAFVVAVVVGADVRHLLGQDLRTAIGLVAAALGDRPGALMTFLAAVSLVALGGACAVFLAYAGTAHVLVQGGRRNEVPPPTPLRRSAFREARAFSVPTFSEGVHRFGRRFLLLGAWLCLGYTLVGVQAVVALRVFVVAERGLVWDAAGGLGALLVLSVSILAISVLNLVHVLLQVIIATDDCRVSQAVRRLRGFVTQDARQVVGVFAIVLGLVILAWAASLLATAGLALVAWVPVVGLAVVPLQVAAWLVRGLVFHFMALGAWSAYQTQYRRYGDIT